MPKLKNGEMVVVKVNLTMMMRKSITNTTNNTHLLRRRLRRREGVLLSADLEEKRPPHVFSSWEEKEGAHFEEAEAEEVYVVVAL